MIKRCSQTLRIEKPRWLAYVAAGAATAVVGTHTAEAEIHYSGPLNQTFNASPGGVASAAIQLDQAGDSLNPFHFRNNSGTKGNAAFFIYGLDARSVAGFESDGSIGLKYASKLGSGIMLSGLANFVSIYGRMAAGNSYANSQWTSIETGFVGFRFNGGSGMQYGWARIHMDEGAPGNSFTLIDYAWADPGITISTGQVPEPGSLALLALGGAGLMAWRRSRSKSMIAA